MISINPQASVCGFFMPAAIPWRLGYEIQSGAAALGIGSCEVQSGSVQGIRYTEALYRGI